MSAVRKSSLRLIWIEAFLALVEGGSFSEAAMAMNCHQSNVSRYIKDLEDWMGAVLFSCKAPLQLSDEGGDFLDDAKTIVEMLYKHQKINAVVVEGGSQLPS